MASDSIAFLYQLQNANYQSLSSTDFQVGVIDPDSAGLSTSQVQNLEASGKNVLAYLSIGEAEDYRGYWQSSWNSNPPGFLLGENPNWPGNYHVEFWDPSWQKIIIDRAVSMAKAGYSGITLDVVDVYQESDVQHAYHGSSDPRSEMMKFVEKIADATKAVNPDFKILQNNALDLLTTNPDDPGSSTNNTYLSHIDGVTAESTFYNPDNTHTAWGPWNLQYLAHAVDAGKEVFAIDYPSSSSAQQSFISQAIDHGFVPYVSDQGLSKLLAVNYQIPGQLPAGILDSFLGHPTDIGQVPGDVGNVITGTNQSEAIYGTSSNDVIFGGGGTNEIHGGNGVDVIYGGSHKDVIFGDGGNDELWGGGGGNNRFEFGTNSGNDVIHDFQASGGTGHQDMIDISHQVYTSRAEVMKHVTYSGNDAVVHLDGNNTITVLGVGDHALTTNDFHIT